MTTDEQKLSLEQKELVAVGSGVGAGCHPCVDHHLKAGAKAGLDGERLLAAVTSAERVTAEAAVAMADHVRGKLGPSVTEPALLSRLEGALASLGAALGANDAANIERRLRIALELGASRPQLEQAIETAHTVQENASRIHLREAQSLLDALAPAVAAAENAGHGCGCKPAEESAEARLEAQAPNPAGETSELADAEAATTGKASGPSAAMADCHRMFEQCMPGAAPAETNNPTPATVAADSDNQEV